MSSAAFLTILSITFAEVHCDTNSTIPLYFSYITSLTGTGFTASGGVPMVDKALENINNRDDILVNYTLKHTGVVDSRCDRNLALDAFFKHFKNDSEPTYVSTFCCGCSTATIPVAEISHYWNIPQMSVSAASVLSNRQRFQNFFRTSPTYIKVPFAIIRMIEEFGWKKLLVVTQNEDLFYGLTSALQSLFERREWIFDRSATIDTNVEVFPFHQVFDKIESEFFRIVFINTYSQYAYYILCEAYHRGYISEKIVWITHSWYNREWWKYVKNKNSSCSSSTIEAALIGSVAVIPDGFILNENKTAVTASRLTPEELLQIYDDSIVNDTYKNIPIKKTIGPNVFFDLIWSLALGLNETATRISERNDTGCEMLSGDLVPLEKFNYSNQKMGCLLRESFQQVHFDGLSGPIKFDKSGGQPDNMLLVQQYRMLGNVLKREIVAAIDVIGAENASFLYRTNESAFTLWKNGPPYDGYPKQFIQRKNIILSVFYTGLSLAGIIFAGVCLVFNLVFRNRRIVKLTSPNLNYIMILGVISLYCCASLYSISEDNKHLATSLCNFRTWLFSFGYTICFAVILAKTWRIYYIFHNPAPTKKIIKDWMLFLCVGFILTVDMLILVIGTAIPSSRQEATKILYKYNFHETVSSSDEILKTSYIFVCITGDSIIWLAVSLAYKGILQIVAIIMAFHIRRVKIKALNDSKEIAAIIYINSIILVIMAVSLFLLEEYHNLHAALFGLALLVQATLFLGILFIPKILKVYRKEEVAVTSFESDTIQLPTATHNSNEQFHAVKCRCGETFNNTCTADKIK